MPKKPKKPRKAIAKKPKKPARKKLSTMGRFEEWLTERYPQDNKFVFHLENVPCETLIYAKPNVEWQVTGQNVFCGLIFLFPKGKRQHKACGIFCEDMKDNGYKIHAVESLEDAIQIFVEYHCKNQFGQPNPFQPVLVPTELESAENLLAIEKAKELSISDSIN